MRAVQACLLLSLVAASPAAAAVSNATVERVSPEMVVVRWSDAAPVDVLVADKPDVAPSVAILASKDDRDGMHQLAAPTSQRLYVTLRDTRDGTVVKVAERLLPLAQSSNFRDIGGYAAAGGKHVRWGKIYRSGATPLLTDADLQEIKALGLANMVDLRSSEEVVLVPTRIRGVPMTSVGYSMGQMMSLDPAKLGTSNGPELYGTFPVFLAPQLRVVFERLLSNDGPLVYNCSAGQGRTGFATAMVLSALGVPRATIIEDYHLSTAYRRPQFETQPINVAAHPNDPVAAMFARSADATPEARKPRPLATAEGRPFLDGAFAAIDARWGSVDAYLRQEIGLTDADIVRLRANYLE